MIGDSPYPNDDIINTYLPSAFSVDEKYCHEVVTIKGIKLGYGNRIAKIIKKSHLYIEDGYMFINAKLVRKCDYGKAGLLLERFSYMLIARFINEFLDFDDNVRIFTTGGQSDCVKEKIIQPLNGLLLRRERTNMIRPYSIRKIVTTSEIKNRLINYSKNRFTSVITTKLVQFSGSFTRSSTIASLAASKSKLATKVLLVTPHSVLDTASIKPFNWMYNKFLSINHAICYMLWGNIQKLKDKILGFKEIELGISVLIESNIKVTDETIKRTSSKLDMLLRYLLRNYYFGDPRIYVNVSIEYDDGVFRPNDQYFSLVSKSMKRMLEYCAKNYDLDYENIDCYTLVTEHQRSKLCKAMLHLDANKTFFYNIKQAVDHIDLFKMSYALGAKSSNWLAVMRVLETLLENNTMDTREMVRRLMDLLRVFCMRMGSGNPFTSGNISILHNPSDISGQPNGTRKPGGQASNPSMAINSSVKPPTQLTAELEGGYKKVGNLGGAINGLPFDHTTNIEGENIDKLSSMSNSHQLDQMGRLIVNSGDVKESRIVPDTRLSKEEVVKEPEPDYAELYKDGHPDHPIWEYVMGYDEDSSREAFIECLYQSKKYYEEATKELPEEKWDKIPAPRLMHSNKPLAVLKPRLGHETKKSSSKSGSRSNGSVKKKKISKNSKGR